VDFKISSLLFLETLTASVDLTGQSFTENKMEIHEIKKPLLYFSGKHTAAVDLTRRSFFF
jgi:hypothetical protein